MRFCRQRSPIDMLIGEYTHSLDEKNRIALPSKFRKELSKTVVMTRGFDSCLFVYPLNEWKKLSSNVGEHALSNADKRGLSRFLFAGAQEGEIDKNGRILIPDFLRQFAGLSERVVCAGVYDRVEMWDEETWIKYREKMEQQGEVLATQLDNPDQ